MKKLFVTLSLLAAISMSSWADVPFRLHRFDSFRATPVNSESIVFYGNSITNMHEWKEAFGNDPRIVNRGNSGAVSAELVDNIETIIAGQPAKLFVGIGTNDLGSADIDVPDRVAANIRTIIERVKSGSPDTRIYIQSILPSEVGNRSIERIKATNCKVKAVCDELHVTYIDVTDVMAGIPTDHSISYDGLHVTAKGYTGWCNKIAPYVGVDCVYPDTATAKYSDAGFDNSFGMRVTQWSADRVTPDDILIIGDEMIHGGEWHELLGNPNVKNRGTGWGYGGIDLTKWIESVDAILCDNPDRKAAPKQIFLYAGVKPAYDGTDFSIFANHYQALINAIRKAAPETEINILSLIPRTSADDNQERTLPINDRLRALANSNDNVNYIDIYTPLATPDGLEADPACITDNYLYGRGYNRIARILAPLVGGNALSADEFEANCRLIHDRENTAGATLPDAGKPVAEGIYDLNGRRMAAESNHAPGLYIVNGTPTLIR